MQEKLLEHIAATAETMGQTISPTAAAMMVNDLSAYQTDDVLVALKIVRASASRFNLKAVIDALEKVCPDGRPGADEAWAMILKDEYTSAVMTEEMAEAYGIAVPLLNDGDKYGARKAFIEAYQRIVEKNKMDGIAPKWFPSLGRDPEMRVTVLQEAVRIGRIGAEHAERIVPPDILNLPDYTTRLAIEDKTPISEEQAKKNIEKIKLMLGNSRIGKSE